MRREEVWEIKVLPGMLSSHPRFTWNHQRPKITLEIQWCWPPKGTSCTPSFPDASRLELCAWGSDPTPLGGKHAGRGLQAEEFSAVQPSATHTRGAAPQQAPHSVAGLCVMSFLRAHTASAALCLDAQRMPCGEGGSGVWNMKGNTGRDRESL